MIIQTSSLGFGKDFTVTSEIPVEEVNEYFADLEECRALEPLRFEAHLVNHGKFIDLQADISVKLSLCCYRCGEIFTRCFASHVSLKLIEASSVGGVEEVILSEDDLDTITYQDPQIHLNDILLESIYLELDDECLCSDNCKGICIQCGKNLNQGPCSCNLS
ncbi:MAG: DUF177 domain-containing protein [Proteobacteria bacterium]|nr:DUF177 domain-containing protein [Pseudomonadota bacterium]